GTAAAEAMIMAHNIVNKGGDGANKFFVSEKCFPQTIDVLRTRANPLGIELLVGNHQNAKIDKSFFGAVLQYPAEDGEVLDYREFIQSVHGAGALAVVATDLLSLVLLTPPVEFGADIVVGNSQRFGVPLGYGGPHAAFFSTTSEFIRHMPGRIIGVSVDSHGHQAYRMTLQTREQHIRREKATSNICTAQALLANIAGMYGVYHGPEGLRQIASNVHLMATALERELNKLGLEQLNKCYFDTVKIRVPSAEKARKAAESAQINFRYFDANTVGVSVDETTMPEDLQKIVSVFAEASGRPARLDGVKALFDGLKPDVPAPFRRSSDFMKHPVFHQYHSESEMMRYVKSLENRDLSLMH
ncbi:MAG: glycine dehydrogenase (aminomethyl-transferring), partial [Bacteroidota bacterium]